jgi:very-short-patch-repair endonuclease
MKYDKDIVTAHFIEQGLPEPTTEHRFHPVRKWRMDFAWPEHKIALEVEGGVYSGGRHTRGAGFVKDCEKYNTAASMGWFVFRCQPKDVCMNEVLEFLHAAFKIRG